MGPRDCREQLPVPDQGRPASRFTRPRRLPVAVATANGRVHRRARHSARHRYGAETMVVPETARETKRSPVGCAFRAGGRPIRLVAQMLVAERKRSALCCWWRRNGHPYVRRDQPARLPGFANAEASASAGRFPDFLECRRLVETAASRRASGVPALGATVSSYSAQKSRRPARRSGASGRASS